MIPKIIHYCWFGRGELPKLAQDCIASWRKYLPDYEIRCCSEDNFDLDCCPYVREAYDARKYAFVSDYARLKVLHDFGGIYMDTDVEVVRNLDEFLVHPAFSGYESERQMPTGIIGSEKEGAWVSAMLALYRNRHFMVDGKPDLTTNVTLFTQQMQRNGLRLHSSRQSYRGIFELYPKDWFCAKDCRTGELHVSPNTHTIHHFSGSWRTRKGFWRRTWNTIRRKLFPQRKYY